MRDTLTWRSPLGFLGVVADKLFVEKHMRTFMAKKQSELKKYAERIAAGGAGVDGGASDGDAGSRYV